MVELVDGPHQPEVPLLYEVQQCHLTALIALRDRHNKTEIGLDEIGLGTLAVPHGALKTATIDLRKRDGLHN
uniref:Unannotated protein n=1 Tax=freshwater metagenome TaxID=449393 RepID=A0A6J7PTY4_9ZZZZ